MEAYVLNFNGRVVKPSVKNFQLIESRAGKVGSSSIVEDHILMQFGRVDDNAFNIDVSFPFSLFQAYAIAISSFDFK